MLRRGICLKLGALAALRMPPPAPPAVFQRSADILRALILMHKPQLHRRRVGGICLKLGTLAVLRMTPPRLLPPFFKEARTPSAP